LNDRWGNNTTFERYSKIDSVKEERYLWQIGKDMYISMIDSAVYTSYRNGVFFVDDKITAMDLSYIPLDNIPDDLWKLTDLKYLSLEYNRLYEIPEDIGNLKNLQELFLGANFINKIPSTISELKDLRVLYLNDNQFDKIPRVVSDLPNLEILSLYNNTVSTISDELAESIDHIPFLDLRKNPIAGTPSEIKFINRKKYFSRKPQVFTKYITRKFLAEGIKYETWKDKSRDHISQNS